MTAPCDCCGSPVTTRGSRQSVEPLLCVVCREEARERRVRSGCWVTGQMAPDPWEIEYE